MLSEFNNLYETLDIDWFSLDPKGRVAHFASGGFGFLPKAIIQNISAYERVFDYLYSLEPKSQYKLIEENLPRFRDANQKNLYISSFVRMASIGYFSYDVIELNNKNQGYKLIAFPEKAIEINELVKINVNLVNFNIISKKEFNCSRLKCLPEDWV